MTVERIFHRGLPVMGFSCRGGLAKTRRVGRVPAETKMEQGRFEDTYFRSHQNAGEVRHKSQVVQVTMKGYFLPRGRSTQEGNGSAGIVEVNAGRCRCRINVVLCFQLTVATWNLSSSSLS